MEKIIVVTGAGDGLGQALAREAVSRGNIAIGIGRNAQSLAQTGEGLPSGRYEHEVADVADWAQVESAIGRVLARHGRIDALFANAAIYPRAALLEQDPADWMHTIAVNVGGVLHACRAVLPGMMDRASGRIVAVGSFADIAPIADSSAYSASKGALHALVKAMATEISCDFPDILINEWVPGALRTGMGTASGIEPAQAARWGLDIIATPAGGPTGRIYQRDQLQVPPRSLKRRIFDRLLMRG